MLILTFDDKKFKIWVWQKEDLSGESETLLTGCISPTSYYFWKCFLTNILFCKFYIPNLEKKNV